LRDFVRGSEENITLFEILSDRENLERLQYKEEDEQ